MAARARESCWCFGAPPQQPRNGLCSPAPSNGRASTPLPSVLRKIEKWGDYEAVGGLIKVKGGAGFVPMKTPLTRAQMASLKKSGKRIRYPHDLQGFVRDQASQGRRVGLVIDLTCHDCLYESELKLCPGVRYVHLATEAKKVLEPWLVERIAEQQEIARRWLPTPAPAGTALTAAAAASAVRGAALQRHATRLQAWQRMVIARSRFRRLRRATAAVVQLQAGWRRVGAARRLVCRSRMDTQ